MLLEQPHKQWKRYQPLFEVKIRRHVSVFHKHAIAASMYVKYKKTYVVMIYIIAPALWNFSKVSLRPDLRSSTLVYATTKKVAAQLGLKEAFETDWNQCKHVLAYRVAVHITDN